MGHGVRDLALDPFVAVLTVAALDAVLGDNGRNRGDVLGVPRAGFPACDLGPAAIRTAVERMVAMDIDAVRFLATRTLMALFTAWFLLTTLALVRLLVRWNRAGRSARIRVRLAFVLFKSLSKFGVLFSKLGVLFSKLRALCFESLDSTRKVPDDRPKPWFVAQHTYCRSWLEKDWNPGSTTEGDLIHLFLKRETSLCEIG